MERRVVKVYNKQQRINLNKNESFKAGDEVAIIKYSEYLELKENNNINKADYEKIIKTKTATIDKRDTTINLLNVDKTRLIRKNNKLIEDNKNLKEIIIAKDKVIAGANDSNLELKNKVLDLEATITDKEETIKELLAIVDSKDTAVTEINNKLLDKSEEINGTIKDYNDKLELANTEYNKALANLKIADNEIENLKKLDDLKSKSFKAGLENVILISEKALTNDKLLNNINTAISKKGRFRRFKGFSLTKEDIGVEDIAKDLSDSLIAIKDSLKLE